MDFKQYDLETLEGKIAAAIYFTCCNRPGGLGEFCEKNDFTETEFREFLNSGINATKAFRVLDEYYSKQARENECYDCGFWNSDYEKCTCPPEDLIFPCPKSVLRKEREENEHC